MRPEHTNLMCNLEKHLEHAPIAGESGPTGPGCEGMRGPTGIELAPVKGKYSYYYH